MLETIEGTLVLSIPADPANVAAARMFVALAAREAGADDETVEDLRVAVSEACSSAVHRAHVARAMGPIEIKVAQADDALNVSIRSTEGPPLTPEPWSPEDAVDGFHPSLAIEMVKALFPGARWEDSEQGLEVSLDVPLNTVT